MTSPFPATGTLAFKVSPVDQNVIAWITPLGNLNPPDHATPTDHIYFYIANPDTGESPLALKYFEEPLRSQLYARVQRLGPELDGTIDVDIAGRLRGNWYSEIGSTAFFFAYDTYDPSQVRISVGGLIGGAAVYSVGPTDPYPRDVAVASGKVRYTLTRSRTGPPVAGTPVGQLLAQMVDSARVQVEIASSLAASADFTASARFLIR